MLDEVIHAPNRLAICAALAPVDAMEFARLRDIVGVSDSVLSKHLAVLVGRGYVRLTKDVDGRRPKTWAELTPEGRRAFRAYADEIRGMLAGSVSTDG
jgi:DNA-binding MarR family transcriptional regulator